MSQITFHSALDPFHATFRLLRLHPLIYSAGPLYLDHLRILDFYLRFPFALAKLRLKNEHRNIRAWSKSTKVPKPYGQSPDNKNLFERMFPAQHAALLTLCNTGHYEYSESTGKLLAKLKAIDPELNTRISEVNESESELQEFLKILVTEYPLLGRDGLKDRSGLLEYRYDAA